MVDQRSDAKEREGQPAGETVSFADRLVGSNTFHELFEHGMALVEDTATYLDSEGREAAKGLPRPASMAYATESMRLTTRLMQLASWLLLQRAVHEGEMTLEQAAKEKSKVRIHGLSTPSEGPGWEELPDKLRRLVSASVDLQQRVQRLDTIFYEGDQSGADETAENPVAEQLAKLSAAFQGGS